MLTAAIAIIDNFNQIIVFETNLIHLNDVCFLFRCRIFWEKKIFYDGFYTLFSTALLIRTELFLACYLYTERERVKSIFLKDEKRSFRALCSDAGANGQCTELQCAPVGEGFMLIMTFGAFAHYKRSIFKFVYKPLSMELA